MSGCAAPSVQRIGFTRLSRNDRAEARSPKVNIIFVHGLRGHPENTWSHHRTKAISSAAESPRRRDRFKTIFRSHSDSSIPPSPTDKATTGDVFWPRDYLPEDLPEADVYTYGYNVDVIGGLFQAKSPKSVSQHGRDLAHGIERHFVDEVPIIFVAHSLGGIVVKDAIRRSELCQSRTRLIIFIGTPHRGSSYATWGVIASNLAKLAFQDTDKRIIETLAIDNEILDNIHDGFLELLHRSNIKIHSFQEGRAMTGVTGLRSKVVGDFSSKVGAPPFETVETIDANHREMARCADKSDPRYHAFVGVIKQFMRSSMLSSQNNKAQESILATRTKPQSGLSLEHTGIVQDMITPKSQYYLKLPKNRRFTGRDATLCTLKEKLFIQEETRKLAIVGLGGVGKTQVALQLAYWVRDSLPDYSVFWVSALGLASFEQAYAEMARQFDIHTKPEEDLKEAVRRYLESDRVGKWLLIVDNADDKEVIFGPSDKPGGIYEYLPESESGLTVFTTRTREVAVAVAENDMIELNEMSTEEATGFFEKAIFDKKLLRDRKMTEELFQELTFLPLAISQAAAYLNQNQTSIERYLELLRSTEQDMVSLMSREFHDNTRYRESKNAVASTWLVSFDQIRRFDSHAAELLSFISCIEWKAIPQSILPEPPVEEEMEHAIGVLCSYAFLTRREEEDMFDMHRLVHVATRVWVQKENAKNHINTSAIRHLAYIFPNDKKENRMLWREYMPHAQHALQAGQECQDEERFELLYWVGRCLDRDRRWKEAIIALEEVCQWYTQHRSEEDGRRLLAEHTLGSVYLDDQRTQEAITILEHVVSVQKKTLADGDENLLGSEHELASAYLEEGRAGEAISLFERIVAIREKTLAEDDDSRLASLQELARAYLEHEQATKAIALLEAAAVLRRRTLAEDDYDRLGAEHNLASAYLDDGRTKEAITLLEHVVATKEKVLAVDDPSRLQSVVFLAKAYSQDNRTDEAICLFENMVAFRRALDICDKRRLAFEHDLASYYIDAGRIKEAIVLLEHVVAVEKELDMSDEERLVSEDTLAGAYVKDRQFAKAIVLLEHVVAVEKELEMSDEERLVSEDTLAGAYIKDRQFAKAIVLLEHVVAVEKELEMSDEERVASEAQLAAAYVEDWQFGKAIILYERVVAIRKALDTRDEGRRISEHNLADAYIRNGRIEEAIVLLEHVVAVEKELDMSDEESLISRERLAQAYVKDWQFGKAIVLLRHVIAVERKLDLSYETGQWAQELLTKAYVRCMRCRNRAIRRTRCRSRLIWRKRSSRVFQAGVLSADVMREC